MNIVPTLQHEMSLMDIVSAETFMEEKIPNIYKFCAPTSVEFWICMNHTIQVSDSGWWGRGCCTLAQAPSCRQACSSSTNATALTDFCRRSDEIDFFNCVQKQQDAQWCCTQTQSLKCHEACQKVLWRAGHSKIESGAREKAVEECDQSPALLKCLKEMGGTTAHIDTSKYLPCCQEAENKKCRSTCESVLKRIDDLSNIEEALVPDCGPPAIDSVIWLCFLKKDQPIENKDLIPYDIAKLHCCEKAKTINCRKLCFQTFNTGWQNNWQKFHSECLSDPQEVDLLECIDEVNSPCSLGCNGLTYCSQLNNRPTSLFRSCTTQADLGAHLAVAEQKGSGFVYVSDLALPLKNSSQCPTDIWRSVACALHVKPCTAKGHSSLLCAEDCIRLVSSCVEWSRAPQMLTAPALCARLAPHESNAPCVPLRQYMTPSTEPALLSATDAVTSPCRGSPCGDNQVCIVNRDCLQGDNCKRYHCVDGCRTNSPYVVPLGSWVRIPMSLPSQKSCYKICNCTKKGMSHCQPLPCVELEDCVLHDKMVCARRACGRAALLTGLPCNCPPHHLPVHARSMHYPNSCLAQCAGATDAEIQFRTQDPCSSSEKCSMWRICLPVANVCLSKLQASCPQYMCLNTYDNCETQPPLPICDTGGRTHANPCYLIKSPGRRMAYWGPCMKRCSNNSTVCGLNGVTYNSECAAWSEFITVDYYGPCLAVGPISKLIEPKCTIDRIVCPPLKKANCLGFTAPGGCCPKCGGALRILYSQKQIDRALYGTNISASVINLQNILKALDRHVKIAECALRGYLTIEMEIFISIETVLQNATDLQLSVCVLEAEKLADMINRQSVLITSDLGLSALSYALTVHTYPTSAASSINLSLFPLLLLVFIFVTR
ncbi:Serine protease inhibitor [Operophtera brumata]|uniref:Serine protease inhibitor n=1 Tax=Operophtera brumata TaxID=104452 RepID=A0A0L7LQS4_OPEBR|nr:Serine protease inhibitor [Operophtera brumata]